MDGGLCLCDVCCTEDASETSEDSSPQSAAQSTKQREEELDEKYNQFCDSLTQAKEHNEALEQILEQGCEFFENHFKKVEKKKSGRISRDECEVTGKKWEEIKDRGGEGCECCMKCMSASELENCSCGNCEIDSDSIDVSGVESDGEEYYYQDIVDGDWECSAEDLEAAMCEDEELFGSLHGGGRHMMECCM